MSTYTTVHVGEYKFTIKDSVLAYGDRILNRSFQIGGRKPDCLDVGIIYERGVPSHGKMSFLEAKEECSLSKPLSRGRDGTVIMVQALLRYIRKEIPSLTTIVFDDMSSIPCTPSSGVSKLNLYHYYIVYHGKTWYEMYFHAHLRDRRHPSEDAKEPEPHIPFHEHYERAKQFMIDSVLKESFPFEEWKDKLGWSNELREGYDRSKHFRAFFETIPVPERCRLLGGWLSSFMNMFMGSNFSNMDWVIDISTVLSSVRGGMRRRKQKNRTRRIITQLRATGGDRPIIGSVEEWETFNHHNSKPT